MKCEECDGRGRVFVERTVGGVTANGPWQSYRGEERECEECNGYGEIDEGKGALFRLLSG